jgi:hypothetical protein
VLLLFVASGEKTRLVGCLHLSPEFLLQKIQYNRDRGIKGEVLFFYEGLRENNDYSLRWQNPLVKIWPQ